MNVYFRSLKELDMKKYAKANLRSRVGSL